MAYKDHDQLVKYNNDFISRSYDRVNLTLPKGQKTVIAEYAGALGLSVNAFIQAAITEKMERVSEN